MRFRQFKGHYFVWLRQRHVVRRRA